MKKSTVFAFIGMVVGCLGAYAHSRAVRAEASGGPPETFLVVKKDVARGQVLTPDALETIDIPAAYIDPRRVPARERDVLLGVPLSAAIRAGEGLYWSDVAGGEAVRYRLAEVVPKGRTAFQLSAGANPFGSMIDSGDLVDVLCFKEGESQKVLSRVLVLAVGERIGRAEEEVQKSGKGGGLSLSLLPEEAETLLRLEHSCQWRVLLRGLDDFPGATGADTSRGAHAPAGPRGVTTAKGDIEHVR